MRIGSIVAQKTMFRIQDVGRTGMMLLANSVLGDDA